ncbi:ATP synthase delta chain [Candidatus Rhodobacter oscarellae]|uniref:D-lyxose ketol-isomerase n=1 Tax=Candidatus Rhodobacter oscarellae TaxID=1675527 RepID=A0A0J9E5J4_9RHOB|nr:D-lyxose/D-mannose family sugar isomerase [Candidatus Rhodobacter lobularis]KMW57089.1 ATP synthase delta chain [Candidatus Rhodobacter lobularis]
MLRSTVNEILKESDAFITSHGFVMPPFAYWSPDQMKDRTAADSAMIRDHMLGWDITDYGQGRFEELGLFLFTVRNGSNANVQRGMGMLYAEKIMISGDMQISPMHRHNLKTEDIINRGGGDLVLELFTAAEDGSIDDQAPVRVRTDGRWREMAAGSRLRLKPGESVTLEPDTWHAFWGENGKVLIGEVSNVNDDRTDNVFREEIGRFSEIEEDVDPRHLLVSDYDRWLN